MGNYCTKRAKIHGPDFNPKEIQKVFAEHEASLKKMQDVKPEIVNDSSEMGFLTEYEA